jgi:hypothetical protein
MAEEEKTQTQKDTEKSSNRTQKRSKHTYTRSEHAKTRSEHTQTKSEHTQKRSEHTVLSDSHSENQNNQSGDHSGAANGASAKDNTVSPLTSTLSSTPNIANSSVLNDSFYQYSRPSPITWNTVQEEVYNVSEEPMQRSERPEEVAGLPFPLQIDSESDGSGGLNMKVSASQVLDFTSNPVAASVTNISEFTKNLGGAGTYYVSLVITIDVNDAKSVTNAAIKMEGSAEDPTDTTLVIAVGEFTLTQNGNAVVVSSVTQYTAGAIYYPFSPAWAQFTASSNTLNVGLQGEDSNPSKDEPAVIKELDVFSQDEMNLVCGNNNTGKLVIGTEVGENEDVGAQFKVNSSGFVGIGQFAISSDGGTEGGYINLTGPSADGIGGNFAAVHKPSEIEFRNGPYGEAKCTIGSQVGSEKVAGMQCTLLTGTVGIGAFASNLDDTGWLVNTNNAGEVLELTANSMHISNSSGSVLEINSNAITQGEITVRTVTKADDSTLEVLATEDFSLSDANVGWANYSGGNLEIGGSNTNGVGNLTLTFTSFLKMIGGSNFEFEVHPTAAELSKFRMGSAYINVQDIGDFVAGDPAQTNDHCTMTSNGISCGDGSGDKFRLGQTDLADSTGVAKFREVKVCDNGVSKSAYILMSDPV